MTDTTNHKPLLCPKCKAELAFLSYGSKIGSNGKPAKWPIYEKCTNRDCSIGRKNLGIHEVEEIPPYEPLPEYNPGIPTKLFQLPSIKDYKQTYYAMTGSLRQLEIDLKSESKSSALRVFMHKEDLDRMISFYGEAIRIDGDQYLFSHPADPARPEVVVKAKNIKVTRGYRYFTVEIHSEINP